MSLLYLALYHNSRNLNQSRLDRKNMIFEFVLNNGGAPVIFTEEGMNCVFFAARTNNKKAFDLLLKNGFDPNRKGPNGKTVLEFLVEQNIKVDPEIMNKLKATTKPSLFSMVLESNADGLKKALEDKENLAAINKPIEPEVILTLEGTLNASGKFVFTGDTIRYDAPGEHQAPSDVTIDGKPWKDLNQPFKLDFTPDFENVIIADRAGGNGVMLNRGSERAELTLFIVDAHAPAPHFVVRLVVKNVSSSRTEPARLNPSELPSGPIPFQQQLQMALERRAVLEKTIRNLELVPDFPEESIDVVRRQLRDLDRMIELLKEVVEKAAARDANEPPSPPPAD